MVADVDLVLVQARALIAKHEESIAPKWMLVHWLGSFNNFNTTYADFLPSAVFLHVFEIVKYAIVHLICSALTAELGHLLGIRINQEHFVEPKGSR